MAAKRAKKKTTSANPPRFDMLFTCIGRRVELLRAFRRAGEKLKLDLRIHGADARMLSPAMHLVDKAHVAPKIASGEYLDALLAIVKKHKIKLVVPLIDTELIMLAEAVDRFRELDCTLLISSADAVRICRDKIRTFETLTSAGIDTPRTWTWEEALSASDIPYPLYMKPRAGSAGMGNFVIDNVDELRTLGQRVPDPIVQEFVAGIEHTLDVYTGFDGVPRCAVPRRRLEVRSGEVSKALVVKDNELMRTGVQVAEALGTCRGVITVQCIVTPAGRIRVIEMNPRFGGGVPLAIQAGADFPRWILAAVLGRKVTIRGDAFRDDVAMLRFDDAVFVRDATRRCQL